MKTKIWIPIIAAALMFTGFAVAPDDASAQVVLERLDNVGPDANASGRARLRVRARRDRVDFDVDIRNVDPGRYDLLVGGAFQGHIDVVRRTGEIEFRNNPEPGEDRLPLTFDPQGQLIEVAQGATVFLSVVFPDRGLSLPGSGAGAPGPGDPGECSVEPFTGRRIRITERLAATGVIPRADGKVRYRERTGRRDVNVQIEDVPVGDYDLLVDGAVVATIPVERRQGEVEFDSRGGEGDLPLTFDPRCQLVEVVQGDDVILHVLFPGS